MNIYNLNLKLDFSHGNLLCYLKKLEYDYLALSLRARIQYSATS